MTASMFEKSGNIWWVKCRCKTWFPANEKIIKHPSVRMLCPACKSTFAAKDAADLRDPAGQRPNGSAS